MAYREPGVYLQVKNSTRGALATGTLMLPLIIGTGATKFKTTVSMVRSAENSDLLPFTKVLSVSLISDSEDGPANYESPTDYTFSSQVIDGSTINNIAWELSKGPQEGDIYYATLIYEAEDSQFELKYNNSATEVISNYGGDIQTLEPGNPINKLSLAAQILCENGGKGVWTLQVKPAGEKLSAAEVQAALDKYAVFETSVWKIIPTDISAEIINVINGHVDSCSHPEERMERVATYGRPYSDLVLPPTSFDGSDGVLKVLGDYSDSVKSRRIIIPYPDTATRTLSDGSIRDLDAAFLLSAIAGKEQTLKIGASRTRMTFGGFNELKGVKMTRRQKNMLAEKGIMILEQDTIGGVIRIRHQLTTDISNVQSREQSIVEIQDYCSKYYRSVCELYIGKYNITPETITKISGTLDGAHRGLVREEVIIDGQTSELYQDEDNPDTIIVALQVLPPYPCNYIDITLYLL